MTQQTLNEAIIADLRHEFRIFATGVIWGKLIVHAGLCVSSGTRFEITPLRAAALASRFAASVLGWRMAQMRGRRVDATRDLHLGIKG
jgi:hypothetical protein